MQLLNYTLLFLVLILSFFDVKTASIVIEINNVIMLQSKFKTTMDIGASFFVGWSIPNENKITDNFFKILDAVYPPKKNMVSVIIDKRELPQVIKEWLLAEENSEWYRIKLIELMKDYHKQTGTKTELYQAMVNHVFTPYRYAAVREVDTNMAQLIKEISKQVDLVGRKKHHIYLSSNQNNQAYQAMLLNNDFKSIVQLCDDVFISGLLKTLKPSIPYFESILNRIDCDDSPIYFIESEIAPMHVEQRLPYKNIVAIHHKSYKETRNQLKKYGVI